MFCWQEHDEREVAVGGDGEDLDRAADGVSGVIGVLNGTARLWESAKNRFCGMLLELSQAMSGGKSGNRVWP